MTPISFEPIFMERVWGGRRLASLYGKALPPGKRIGESWEMVDRPEAQSIVARGPLQGKTVHQLWVERRAEIFGAGLADTPRFPILVKLLDATDKLSLQVHPPESAAQSLGAEAKSEFWYFAASEPGAEIFAGMRSGVERSAFVRAIEEGDIAAQVHRIGVKTGDSFFVPSGRLHGIGGGNVIVEIQQNSDSTYRVFDWDREDEKGRKRELHVNESLQSIRFDDCEPRSERPKGERLIECLHFAVEKWEIEGERPALDRAAFAIFVCLSGELEALGEIFRAGDLFLVPACAQTTNLRSLGKDTSLLRITLPVR